MKLNFGYGKSVQEVEIPDKNLPAIPKANPITHKRTGREAVYHALSNPIGAKRLRDTVTQGQKIVIITSDISGSMPTYDVLPPVLEEIRICYSQPNLVKSIF